MLWTIMKECLHNVQTTPYYIIPPVKTFGARHLCFANFNTFALHTSPKNNLFVQILPFLPPVKTFGMRNQCFAFEYTFPDDCVYCAQTLLHLCPSDLNLILRARDFSRLWRRSSRWPAQEDIIPGTRLFRPHLTRRSWRGREGGREGGSNPIIRLPFHWNSSLSHKFFKNPFAVFRNTIFVN